MLVQRIPFAIWSCHCRTVQQVNYSKHHLVIKVPRIIRHNELMNMY